MANYYSVLEVTRTASQDDIRKSYKLLAKKWHPDKNLESLEEATVKFKEITRAFEVLSDESRRKIYDHILDSDILTVTEKPSTSATEEAKMQPPRHARAMKKTSLLDSMLKRKSKDDSCIDQTSSNEFSCQSNNQYSNSRPPNMKKTTLLGVMLGGNKNSVFTPPNPIYDKPSSSESIPPPRTKTFMKRRHTLLSSALRGNSASFDDKQKGWGWGDI